MEEQKDGGQKKGWGFLSKFKKGPASPVPQVSQAEPERVRDENRIEPGERIELTSSAHLTAPDNGLYIIQSNDIEKDGRYYKVTPCVYILTEGGEIIKQKPVVDTTDRKGAGLHILPQQDKTTAVINNTPLPFERTELQEMPFGKNKKIEAGGLRGFVLPPEPVAIALSPSVQVTLGKDRSGADALFFGDQIIPLNVDGPGIASANLGRQEEGNDLVVRSPEVSRQHGQIVIITGVNERFIFLRDKNSTNGMEVIRAPLQALTQDEVDRERERQITKSARSKWFVSENTDSLRKEKFEGEKQGRFTFVFPAGTPPELRTQIFGISTSLDAQLRIPTNKAGSPINMMIVPGGKKYVTRSSASGTDILMNTDAADVAAHELIHAKMYGEYGSSAADAVTEGLAVYVTFEVVSEAPNNDVEKHYGYRDILSLEDQNQTIGLSHTAVNRKLDRELDTQDEYEYSYRYGRYLVEFIDKKYGREFLLNFYKNTCNEVVDNTGKRIALYGRREDGVRQGDVVAAALENTGRSQRIPLNLDEFKGEWDTFYKAKTREIKNKGIFPAWLDGR